MTMDRYEPGTYVFHGVEVVTVVDTLTGKFAPFATLDRSLEAAALLNEGLFPAEKLIWWPR